jgi:hypothetical protein
MPKANAMKTLYPNTPTTADLAGTDFLHLQGQSVLLRAEYGTLWVTEDGEADDHEVGPGHERIFDGHAPLTIGTLGGRARVRVVPLAPARTGWIERLAGWAGRSRRRQPQAWVEA